MNSLIQYLMNSLKMEKSNSGRINPARQVLAVLPFRPGGSIQEWTYEALNDLFAKYDVPQVAGGEE